MKKNILFLITCASLLLSMGFAQASEKTRIAVMDFDNKTQQGGWRVGQGASDMLATELVKLGKFSVIERDKVASILKEQKFGMSGAVDSASAANIGKILGVEYIVTGAVTEYGRSKGGGGGGGVVLNKMGYHATVDIRIVNTSTAEIVFAESASGEKGSLNVRVFGFGGGESFNEKHASAAMREAIGKVGQRIVATGFGSGGGSGAVTASTKATLVADIEDGVVTLNRGSDAGYKVGQTLVISRKGKVIKDPSTGKVIKIKYKKIGTIKLIEVDNGYSEGKIISGSGIAVKDIVQ